MELNKVLTAEETAKELMRQHYIENYKTYADYDMTNAKQHALITTKFMYKQLIISHKKLVASGVTKSSVEETSTYKFLEEVKAHINSFEGSILDNNI
jgi:hypothetical protein